jgi:DNA-binding transcriptional LysR family regulator
MALSLPALESFYWVAQLRSFNAAADKLGVTQPTVSYRIGEIEDYLGVSLFVRQKRQLSLTSEGESLKQYAEAMIAIARDIESNIRTRNTRLPTLRVGVMDSFAVVGLPALLEELDRRFYGTRVAATVDTSHSLARQLSDGLLEIAVLSTPPPYDNVALDLLGRQTVAWIASPKLGLSRGVVAEAELAAQRIFSTPAPSNLHSLTMAAFAGSSGAGLRLNVCNSLGAIINLVEAGTGIAILPTRLLQEALASGGVHVVATRAPLATQEVFIGTNKGTIVSALPQVAQMIRKVSAGVGFCD